MSSLKKFFFVSLALALVFSGLWLVVMNDQAIALNLLFLTTPPANAGLVIFVAFAAGCLIGLLIGLNLLELAKLNSRLYWLRREVRQLQEALGDKR